LICTLSLFLFRINHNLTKEEKSVKELEKIAEAAEYMSFGDIIANTIQSSQNYALAPSHAVFSSIAPASSTMGTLFRANFPRWLGKNSQRGKRKRLLREATAHSFGTTHCTKTSMALDYLPSFVHPLTYPMISLNSAGIQQVIDFMDIYHFDREDWESILELNSYSGGTTYLKTIKAPVKTKFTRTYNALHKPFTKTTTKAKKQPKKANNKTAPPKQQKQKPQPTATRKRKNEGKGVRTMKDFFG